MAVSLARTASCNSTKFTSGDDAELNNVEISDVLQQSGNGCMLYRDCVRHAGGDYRITLAIVDCIYDYRIGVGEQGMVKLDDILTGRVIFNRILAKSRVEYKGI